MFEHMPNDPLSLLQKQLDIKTAEQKEEEAKLRRLKNVIDTSSLRITKIMRDKIRLQKAIKKLR